MSQRPRFASFLGHGLAVCLLSLTVTTARGDQASSPRCALIDSSKSPVAALVEAELLAQPDTMWLERTEIDRVMAEQELSALLGATALQGRVALGQALKADILVMLDTKQENQQQLARIVVAESTGGLRLLSTRIPLTDDAGSDAKRIVRRVREAIERYGEEITEVFTVPPFYSRDLVYDFDDLKRTYATLVQQRLLAQPGVLLVELEEADAIAREYALANPGDGPTRRLPLYLLGEYRNEGVGDQRQVAITMRLKRGDKILRTTEETVSPDAAADFLMQAAGDLAGWKEDREIGASSRIEARQLAERGAEFLQLGDWDEALALSQASLLMRPNQPHVHAQAVRAASMLADANLLPEDVQTTVRRIAYRRLAVQHLATVARSQSDLDKLRLTVAETLQKHRVHGALWRAELPKEITEPYARLLKEERAFLAQLVHRFARAKRWHDCSWILSFTIHDIEPSDRYALASQFISWYQDQAPAASLINCFGHAGFANFTNSYEARQFLEDLASASQSDPTVQQAARASLQQLNEHRVSRSMRVPDRPTREVETSKQPRGYQLQPLQVTWRDAKDRTGKLTRIHGCLPIGDGADVLWQRHVGVYLMREQGEAKLIWPDNPIQNVYIRSVDFDGQYVWFTASIHRQVPQVWVFEPATNRRWQLTADHGLPLVLSDSSKTNSLRTPDALVATFAPGKAIVAGSFGRSWLARVEFDPDGNHQVKIFHEARNVHEKFESDRWKDPHVAFGTTYLIGLKGDDPGDDPAGDRIVVGRGVAGMSSYPLVVNPHTLSVQVWHEGWYKDPQSDIWRGADYGIGVVPSQTDTIALLRSTAANLKPEPIMRGVKEGFVVMQDDAVNVVGKQWWRGTLADGKLACLGDVPWVFANRMAASGPPDIIRIQPTDFKLEALARSNQYGLLASYYPANRPLDATLCQVLFHAPTEQGQPPTVTSAPDLETPAEPTQAQPIVDNVSNCLRQTTVAAVSRDHRHLATANSSDRILVWSTDNLRPIRELLHQQREVLHMDFSPNGQRLASTGQNRTVLVWNVLSGEELLKISLPNMGAQKALFGPQGQQLFTADTSGTVISWDMATGQPTRIETLKYAAGFLPDGTLLGNSRRHPKRLIAWNPVDQSYRQVWDRAWGIPVAVSPDGKCVVTSERNGYVDGRFTEVHRWRLWDLHTGQELADGDRKRPLEFYHVDLSDKLIATRYFSWSKCWRFELITP